MPVWGPELYCETCRTETLFEVPPCLDGHGADCPELVCTRCGDALLLVPIAVPPRPRENGPRARRDGDQARQRRAA